MANIINGGDLMFFINGKSVAFATSHKLTINAETVETSSKDSGGKWVTKSVKKLSWNGTTENLYSNDGEGVTFDTLFDLMVAR
jgi:predicted secreted protein